MAGSCSEKEGERKGAWSSEEDELLIQFAKLHGEGKWTTLAKKAGLKRSGKSCRLRWLNYLRPGIKRGDFTWDEEELILKLHKMLGNRWALIAGRLPGRTDNEVKNYWNSNLCKKVQLQGRTSSRLSPIRKCKSEEKKSAVQRYSCGKLQENIAGKNKEENLQTNPDNAVINSASLSVQLRDQDNHDSSVFNSNKDMISLDTLNFDFSHENCNKAGGNAIFTVSCNPENENQQLHFLQEMELRKIASLLDIENEFRRLL